MCGDLCAKNGESSHRDSFGRGRDVRCGWISFFAPTLAACCWWEHMSCWIHRCATSCWTLCETWQSHEGVHIGHLHSSLSPRVSLGLDNNLHSLWTAAGSTWEFPQQVLHHRILKWDEIKQLKTLADCFVRLFFISFQLELSLDNSQSHCRLFFVISTRARLENFPSSPPRHQFMQRKFYYNSTSLSFVVYILCFVAHFRIPFRLLVGFTTIDNNKLNIFESNLIMLKCLIS